MILLGQTARDVFRERLAAERVTITTSGYSKHDLKKVLKYFDENVVLVHKYLERKLIVFKYHHKHLWGEACTFWWIPPKGISARHFNTANRHISDSIRDLGKKYGWLP